MLPTMVLATHGFGFRKSEAYFSGNWGTLSLGHGPTASDSMGDADLSNTWLADFSTTTWGGTIAFRTSGGETEHIWPNGRRWGGHRSHRGRYYHVLRRSQPSFSCPV